MTQNRGAANNIAINVTKPKLEQFRGNDRDELDIKSWCMQVTRLDTVQGHGNVKTATIVMEALREQALHWALLLQDEDPDAAADWKLLKPLLIERFDKAVNETHKLKLIAALQQRQNENGTGSSGRSGPSTQRRLGEQRTAIQGTNALNACLFAECAMP
jgi:hypothetical protein